MKIVICTTPIRSAPTEFPPFGSLAIIGALRRAGYVPVFYDIDGLRPSLAEVERFFAEQQPDVAGISAVVSTSYAYAKRLAQAIRRVSPRTRIVLGGNMAASAELLHRLAGIDVCVIGEGEVVAVNLLRVLEANPGPLPHGALAGVRGVTFLDPAGDLIFTGYEDPLPASEVFDPDFSILERWSRIGNFFRDPLELPDFALDPRSAQPHRKGKKAATLVTAKGCVNRCTFCHRWDKGYRPIPVPRIIEKLRLLQERYNVGFLSFSDENFGSDRRHTEELVAALKPLDVLWEVGGVRVRSMDLELLRRMKDAGCVAVYYGMESGSPGILKLMDKKITREQNLAAARFTREAGVFTIFQMVIGMPGETRQTIRETTEFLKAVTEDAAISPRSLLSINYVQALPGTAVYEYARARGLIGSTLADEERYLLSISDIDAMDDQKLLNFTEADVLTVRSWRRQMVLEVLRHYHQRRKTPVPGPTALFRMLLRKLRGAPASPDDFHGARRLEVLDKFQTPGFFNVSIDLPYDLIVAYFYPLRHVIVAAWLLINEFRRRPFPVFLKNIKDFLRRRVSAAPERGLPPVSLRELLPPGPGKAATAAERAMASLRAGR